MKTKLVVIAMAGLLAMCFGLTACGGGSSSSSSAASSSTASSSTASSSSSSSSESVSASNKVLYYEGTLSDGQIVDYYGDMLNSTAALSIAKSDYSSATVWYGTSSVSEDGVVTITDADTNHTVNYTLMSNGDSLLIDIQNYGEAELKPVTEAEFKEIVEKLAKTDEGKKLKKQIKREVKKLENRVAKQAKKLMEELADVDDNTVLFWDGTFEDMTVSYMDNADKKKAYLAVVKEDLSDGAVWYGKYTTSQDGKLTTLTDSESGATVAYEVVETTPGSALKLVFSGVGEVDLKPVTKADFMPVVEKLSKLTDKN